jgi:hypothetical protein
VKTYLINQVQKKNKGNFKRKFDYRKGFVTKHDPAIIREIGFENAMYYEAWVEIFKVHSIYNEEFRRINIELYKKNSNSDFCLTFPKRYVKYSNLPDSIQCAIDLNENSVKLLGLLKLEQIPYVRDTGGNRVQRYMINSKSAKDFRKLCTEFLKEAANNNEKGLVERNKKFYSETVRIAEECIELLKNPELQQCDMTIVDSFEFGRENWFVQIFNCLDDAIYSFKNDYPFVFDSQIIPKEVELKELQSVATDQISTVVNAEKFISFMNGENVLKGGEIMNEFDYIRLLKYTQELMDLCRVPVNIEPIPKINLRKQDIIYTFSKIHDNRFPEGKLRKEYFVFLDKVFSQLHQPEINIENEDNYLNSNCYKKFRTKPDKYHKLNKI